MIRFNNQIEIIFGILNIFIKNLLCDQNTLLDYCKLMSAYFLIGVNYIVKYIWQKVTHF